jgi:hypothetical protein
MKTIYCDIVSLIYCVDAHRRGKRFIVKSDELLDGVPRIGSAVFFSIRKLAD